MKVTLNVLHVCLSVCVCVRACVCACAMTQDALSIKIPMPQKIKNNIHFNDHPIQIRNGFEKQNIASNVSLINRHLRFYHFTL